MKLGHTARTVNVQHVLILAWSLTLFACDHAVADNKSRGYEIEGTATVDGIPLIHKQEGKFVIRVEDCRWNIRFEKANYVDYKEAAYDGTNLTTLFSYEHFSAGRKVANLATVHVSTNEIPRSEFVPQFAMIWLTYGSRCYFDKHHDDDLLAPVHTWDRIGPIDRLASVPLYHSTWERQNQFPFLPTQVVYLDDMPQSRSSLHSKNYTNSIFFVASVTNFEGLTFPKTAFLETYQLLQASNSTAVEITLFLRYELSLAAIHNIGTSQFVGRPSLPGPTLFVDGRIPQVGQIMYFSSNWVSESEITNSKGFKSFKIRKSTDFDSFAFMSRTPWKRTLVLIMLAGFSVIPLVLLIKNHINKKTK